MLPSLGTVGHVQTLNFWVKVLHQWFTNLIKYLIKQMDFHIGEPKEMPSSSSLIFEIRWVKPHNTRTKLCHFSARISLASKQSLNLQHKMKEKHISIWLTNDKIWNISKPLTFYYIRNTPNNHASKKDIKQPNWQATALQKSILN